MAIEGTKLTARGFNLDPQELRFSVLFWDRLVWPEQRAIGSPPTADETFLLNEGVLTRKFFELQGDIATELAKGHIRTFTELEAQQPGQWALAQGANSLIISDAVLAPAGGRTLLLQLFRAIPVPDFDAPLGEVLRFREQRMSELLALRAEVDGLYAQVTQSNDPNFALQQGIKRIDRACADLLKSSRGSNLRMRLSDFTATFEIKPAEATVAAVIAWQQTSHMGMTAATLAAAGAAAASASLKTAGKVLFPGLRNGSNPFRYVSSFHAEFL